MKSHKIFIAVALALTATFATSPASAEGKKFEPVEFTKEYLSDPAKIAKGKEIWFEQCTHCHGDKAYPGKAPKLKPKRYKPAFVYKRLTKGFRKMPAWDEVYDLDERMAITAYIMDKNFAP